MFNHHKVPKDGIYFGIWKVKKFLLPKFRTFKIYVNGINIVSSNIINEIGDNWISYSKQKNEYRKAVLSKINNNSVVSTNLSFHDAQVYVAELLKLYLNFVQIVSVSLSSDYFNVITFCHLSLTGQLTSGTHSESHLNLLLLRMYNEKLY